MRFFCDKKFYPQAKKIIQAEFGDSVKVKTITSGKLRRYNHLTFWQHFTIPSIIFGNLIDCFKNIAGLFQSLCRLIAWRPDIIFCKGGFVCVPVGIAAWILRIPIVIHDSDAHPGLANRILSRFATKILTGAPLEFYKYPKSKSAYVGIPISENFKKYSKSERDAFKKELGFSVKEPLVVVTGGGLGAERLNNAIVSELDELTNTCQIALVSGAKQYSELKEKTTDANKNFHLYGFIAHDMWKYLAAADLVVARAGATSNLELAGLGKATILVPNGRLTGGHQLKNANVYKKSGAVEIVSDDEIENKPEILSAAITSTLTDKAKLKELGSKFSQFSKPDAAKNTANIILDIVK